MSASLDRNDLAFWFPLIKTAGLPVPQTEIVKTETDLMCLLDGEMPKGWDAFLDELQEAVQEVGGGDPVFLRTGHLSGKHSWRRTCYVEDPLQLERHVCALVEESACAGLFGLPMKTWAVRELIPTVPVCCCEGYGGMPVTREFRLFVRDGVIEHLQPYWPPGAVEEGRPDKPDWRERLEGISSLTLGQLGPMVHIAKRACKAVGGGYWSVDLLQDEDGRWWLTDMALGDESFRYEPEAT